MVPADELASTKAELVSCSVVPLVSYYQYQNWLVRHDPASADICADDLNILRAALQNHVLFNCLLKKGKPLPPADAQLMYR